MSRHRPTPTDAERVRDSVVDGAIRAGRIAAADRDRYRRMYDAQPQVARQLLTAKVEEGGLMPGLVGPGEDPATAAAASDYDPSWLSGPERERVARASGGSSPTPPTSAPSPTPAPAVPLGEVGVSAEVPASPPRAQPQRTSAPAAGGSGEEYPTGSLTVEERERISAAREGRYSPGQVQFDEGVRPR